MSKSVIREEYLERSIIPISMEDTNKIMNQMKLSVCKIFKVGKNGTGFFCKLPYGTKLMHFLITNNHVLNYEDIGIDKDIKLSINDGKQLKNIKIDNTRIILTNEKLDYSLIEINQKKDNIDISQFLEIDDNFNIDENFVNEVYTKSIYTIHYPKGDNVAVSYGLLSTISENNILHLCSTEKVHLVLLFYH